ncbi:MAG: hypothetical protein LBI77_02930, partial [Puniceicoccales bacterium]|nr:hypothetical protein [Puniceicoccales bacterium]
MSNITNNNVQCFNSLDEAMKAAHDEARTNARTNARKNAKEAGSSTGESSTKVGNYTITAKTELHGGWRGKLGMVKGTSFEIKKMGDRNAELITKGIFNKGKYQTLGEEGKIESKKNRQKDQNIADQITTISKEIETIKGYADDLNRELQLTFSGATIHTEKDIKSFKEVFKHKLENMLEDMDKNMPGETTKEHLLKILNFPEISGNTPMHNAAITGNINELIGVINALEMNPKIENKDLMKLLCATDNFGNTP